MHPRFASSTHKFEGLCNGTFYAAVETYGLSGHLFSPTAILEEMEIARYSEMHVNLYYTTGVTYSNIEIFNQCLFWEEYKNHKQIFKKLALFLTGGTG